MSERTDNMQNLPKKKVRVGEEVYIGYHDAERGVIILEDGRIVRVGNPQPRLQTQIPQTQTAGTAALQGSGTSDALNTEGLADKKITLDEEKEIPGIQKPKTALERMEAKKRELAEREARKKEQLSQKGPYVPDNKKAEAERKKQEALEQKNIRKLEKTRQKELLKEKKLAEKIAKRDAKKNAKISGDAANFNPGKVQRKKILLAITYILIIVVLMYGAKTFLDNQQEEITVVRLKSDMLAGEVIREHNIEPFRMLKKTYDELGTVLYTSSDGNTSTRQIIYRWEQKDEVVGKYIAIYTQGGQYLTLKNVTDKKIIRNPWLAEVGPTQEIYTLPISTEGINTRLLLPGSHLRVRVIIQQKGKGKSSDPFASPYDDDSYNIPIIGENEFDKQAILEAGGTVPIATVVFDDLVAVDMLNAKGESIFDIYMALSKLPIEERAKYLETTIQGDSNAFQQKVLPTALVLVLTKEQATAMAEFENMTDAVIKYTILPYKDDEGNLLSSFTEIADQMSDIIQKTQQDAAISGGTQ